MIWNETGEKRGEESTDLKEIADSCVILAGSYKKMTHEEILEILQEFR